MPFSDCTKEICDILNRLGADEPTKVKVVNLIYECLKWELNDMQKRVIDIVEEVRHAK